MKFLFNLTVYAAIFFLLFITRDYPQSEKIQLAPSLLIAALLNVYLYYLITVQEKILALLTVQFRLPK